MESSLLASGLGFPEGPTVLGDGRIVLCDGNTGELLAYQAGEMLLERPGSYPNGIAFDAKGQLYWSESKAHRVCLLEGGEAVTFCQLPETHVPDGMAFAADGRLFVANTTFGGVTVLSPDGEVLTEIDLDEHATNCVFDGSTLYVTATRTPDIEASERTGSLSRVETDAVRP